MLLFNYVFIKDYGTIIIIINLTIFHSFMHFHKIVTFIYLLYILVQV